MINIFVSGDRRTVAGDTTIEKLLIAEKVEMPEYVSVSVNEQFIAKEEFSSFVLRDGDVVEFLYYMGGGAK
ncbi:MAG: sulfur carrier protein ThiS [Christensenellaceae bacterium]